MTDCPQCAELRRLLTQAEEAQAELATQLAGRDHQLRKAGADYITVKRKLDRLEQGEPADPDVEPHVERLLKLWAELHRADRKRAPDIDLDGPRAAQVRRMLKKFSRKAPKGSDKRTKFVYAAERLENAIRGCTLHDWAMGRIRKSGGKSFNDIEEHILASVQSVEDNEELWLNHEVASRSSVALQGKTSGQGVGGGAVGSRPTHRELTPEDFDAKEAGQNKWSAFCPAHDDRRDRSLSISYGRDGKLLVHCFAGCTAEDIAAAKGVTVQSLFPVEPVPVRAITPAKPLEPLPPKAEEMVKLYATMLPREFAVVKRIREVKGWTPSTLRTLEVGWDKVARRITFPIRDAQGTLVNVVRYLPNAPKGTRKSDAIFGRPRDLFPALESIEGNEVWLVEGEADAITGHELGLPAVATPGVGNFKVGWAVRFSGRHVVICLDADEADPGDPVTGKGKRMAGGREEAQRVASLIVPHVASVRVVDLAPERTDGFDLGDAHLAGVTADDLRKLAAEAPVIERLSEAA